MTTKHILIVDDEPKVAFFLSKAVEHAHEDYRVSVVHSGEEALEVINRSQVNLLVTDLRMPGISGLELIRWVQASSPQTRTILITAYGNDDIEAEARRLEAYRYITKPFDIGDFTRVVQEALRDMAISRPGLVVLSGESCEAIAQQLESLRYDVSARCIFLADMQGQRLAEVGDIKGLETATLLALLAGGFATSGELARQFGSGKAVNLNFHEGTRYDIYSANVGGNLFLAIVYDRQVQASRIGIVWLYTRRTIERLLSVLSTAEATAPTQSLDTDFGSSLMAELDTVLTEGPLSGSPPQDAVNRSGSAGLGQSSPAGSAEPAQGNNAESALADPHAGREDERETDGLYSDGGEPERKLLDIETAIARGLIPPELGMEHIKRTGDQEKASPPHQA